MALLNKLSGRKSNDTIDEDLRSIVENINHVLSTTRDYGFFLRHFGISDYRYLGTRDGIAEAIISEINENIEHFEPRVILKGVESINEGNKLARLAFRIDCEVRKTGRPFKLFLNPVDNRYQIIHD